MKLLMARHFFNGAFPLCCLGTILANFPKHNFAGIGCMKEFSAQAGALMFRKTSFQIGGYARVKLARFRLNDINKPDIFHKLSIQILFLPVCYLYIIPCRD
jgi:hypothetical protein